MTEGEVLLTEIEKGTEVRVKSGPRQYFYPRFVVFEEKEAIRPKPNVDFLYEVRAEYKNLNAAGGMPDDYGWGEFGGVMGWLDPETKTGIGVSLLGITKGKGQVQIAEYDLTKGFSNGISTENFRMMSGKEFALQPSALNRREFMTFILRFHRPGREHVKAWPEAKVRVELILEQNGEQVYTQSFLANVPAPAKHRAGYFGGSSNVKANALQAIGIYRNLQINTRAVTLP